MMTTPLYTIRRAATLPAGELAGLAATWALQSDGYQLQRGAFRDDVERIGRGEILPVLFMHNRMETPVARIAALAEVEEGLRFAGEWGKVGLQRGLDSTVADGTTRDISVSIPVFEVDPVSPRRVIRARLDEISVCTTGFAVDQGAGIGRASLYDMADALQHIAALRCGIDRLIELLSRSGEEGWGPQASDALTGAVGAEARDLHDWIKKQFKTLAK
jgi:hypothetical protein